MQSRFSKIFVKSGDPIPKDRPRHYHVFQEARDWQVAADLPNEEYDFTQFANTAKRPDIVVWSPSTKQLIVGELTVPCEENTAEWHTKKSARYVPDLEEAEAGGWNTSCFAFEVGARGFVCASFGVFLNALDLSRDKRRLLLKDVSRIALECSCLIYTLRHCATWEVASYKE